MSNAKSPDCLTWVGDADGHLRMIDQTLLPTELKEIDCQDVETIWEAIKMLRVRGAPAIGIAAAYGVCIGLQSVRNTNPSLERFFQRLQEVTSYLAESRPTAVNLFWALDRLNRVAKHQKEESADPQQIHEVLLTGFQRGRLEFSKFEPAPLKTLRAAEDFDLETEFLRLETFIYFYLFNS